MDVHDEQLNEFRSLVMLESVFEWILSSSLDVHGAKNQVINTNATHVFETDRSNNKNDVFEFWYLEILSR